MYLSEPFPCWGQLHVYVDIAGRKIDQAEEMKDQQTSNLS